jgi:cytochrome c553
MVLIPSVHRREKSALRRSLDLGCGVVLALAAGAVYAGDVAAGKAKYENCVACHGRGEDDAAPNVPSLVGKAANYIRRALYTYKRCRPDDWLPPCGGSEENILPYGWEHRSKDRSMREIASELSDADIDNIAAYIATLRKP